MAATIDVIYERRFKSSYQALQLNPKLKKLRNPQLDRPGIDKVGDLMAIFANSSVVMKADDMMMIAPLVYHLAATISRIDTCYCIVDDMLKSNGWYVDRLMSDYRIKLRTFRFMIQQLMPQTYAKMVEIQAIADEHLHKIFVGLFFDILSHDHAMRILDLFMLEGEKILFRFGYAILYLFKRQAKTMNFKSADDFWKFISDNSQNIEFRVLSDVAFENNRTSLGKFFQPTLFSRQQINNMKDQARRQYDAEAGSLVEKSALVKIKTDLTNTAGTISFVVLTTGYDE